MRGTAAESVKSAYGREEHSMPNYVRRLFIVMFALVTSTAVKASGFLEHMPPLAEKLFPWSEPTVHLKCEGPTTNLSVAGCQTAWAFYSAAKPVLAVKELAVKSAALTDAETGLPYVEVVAGKRVLRVPVNMTSPIESLRRAGAWSFVDVDGVHYNGDIATDFVGDITNLIPHFINNRTGLLMTQSESTDWSKTNAEIHGEIRWGTVTNGLREGVWHHRTCGDTWVALRTYRSGIEHGLFRTWSPGGGFGKNTATCTTGWYHMGQPNGCWYTIDETGELLEATSWQKGRMNGGQVLFAEFSGLIRGIRSYKDDVTTGEWVFGDHGLPCVSPASLLATNVVPSTKLVKGEPFVSPFTKMSFVWIDTLGIWVGKYEVTNEEYRQFDPEHASGWEYHGDSVDRPRQPVANIGPGSAGEFASWMTLRDQENGVLPVGFQYRLPTDKEWDVFARCGDERVFP